jgi:23S rRNA (adenine2503-C2)-methyltransferase
MAGTAEQTDHEQTSTRDAASVSLLDFPMPELGELLRGMEQPRFRAAQVFRWLHVRGVSSFDEMTDLPAALRAELAERYSVWTMRLAKQVKSGDESVKYAWRTRQGDPVEAVLMPGFEYGTTVCLSSQSGCGMACKFCQTGYMGLRSYLSASEILQQLYESEADSGVEVERAVFMGMGEPLLNLRNVRKAIDMLCAKDGRAWSPRRITVSTVGLVKPMLLMGRSFPRVNLALSLHFTTIDARKTHMPEADSDLRRLAEALYFYRSVNGGKVTIEYALMLGLNDGEADARRLIRFARLSGLTEDSELMLEAQSAEPPPNQQALPLHVNLIAYNPIRSAPQYQPTSEKDIDAFAKMLSDAGVPVTVRHSRGQDVSAACGMLGSELG